MVEEPHFATQDKEHTDMAIVGKPRNLRNAIESRDASMWELAMQLEYEYLIANGTWDLTPFSKGHKAMKCKCVFYTKKNANDMVVCFKTRLVAKGCFANWKCTYWWNICSHGQIKYNLCHTCISVSHGSGNASNGCENNIFEQRIRHGNLYGATGGIWANKPRAPRM